VAYDFAVYWPNPEKGWLSKLQSNFIQMQNAIGGNGYRQVENQT
jgi:hypothetical protein